MKIGIYAPCKNEIKNVKDWYESCKEADYIYVTDTGSSDGTAEELAKLGVIVTDIRIKPWRFDLAFNIALSLLPEDTDVCVRLDLDERLEPGWRQLIEQNWKIGNTTRLRYTYVWNWNDDGTPGRTWSGDRIHARDGFLWVGATHEGLCCRHSNEVSAFCMSLKILHFPDVKDKSGDLPLLLEAAKEMPHDARMKAYLAREYMYQNQYENATKTYREFLAMSSDKAERGQAMVSLSKTDSSYKVFWLKMAALEVPTHREPLCELAQYYYNTADWMNCYNYAKEALTIVNHPMDYTCTPEAWGEWPHDLMSIAAWNVGLFQESLEQAKIAVEKNPSDDRLKTNLRLVEEFIKNQS